MPRIVAATKCQKRSLRGRHFENHVVEIIFGTKQPKPATSGLPPGIHINEDCDDFRLRVSVDFAVFFAATAADSNHVGPILEIDGELFLECLAKLIAAHLLDQICKGRSVSHLTERKADRPVYLGII